MADFFETLQDTGAHACAGPATTAGIAAPRALAASALIKRFLVNGCIHLSLTFGLTGARRSSPTVPDSPST